MEEKKAAMRREVLLIATGGTIVSPKKGGSAAPDAGASRDLLSRAEGFFRSCGFSVKIVRPFGSAGIDSSDMGPVQWVKLAKEISGALSDNLQGILITHGTDTMAYTAAWLSIFFSGLGIPIILTGSQKSPDEVPFDGDANLMGAARMVIEGISGVYIYFNWRLFNGFCAHKRDSQNIDAFCEYGYGRVGLCAEKPGSRGRPFDLPARYELILRASEEEIISASRRIAICFVLPGFSPKLSGDEDILIIVGFGAGNIPESYHREILEKYKQSNKPCVIACSQAEEGQREPWVYRNVGIGCLENRGFTVFRQRMTLEFVTAAAYFAVLAPVNTKDAVAAFFM